MTHFTDRTNLGFFPLQDHTDRVPASVRQSLAAGRITKMKDVASAVTGADAMQEYGVEDGMGTLGDVHPWLFWQVADRTTRGMGAWAQMVGAMVTEGGTGGFGGGTGHPVSASSVLPFRDRDLTTDPRFSPRLPGWPQAFPSLPKGTVVVVAPAMEETDQHIVMLHADPRMVSADNGGPAEAGSLVCDLQPDGELCMDSTTPGVDGRHGRLQSLIRVVAVPRGGIPDVGSLGNILALNYTTAKQDGLAGLGAVFANVRGGGGGGPTTGGGGGGPITQSGSLLESTDGADKAGETGRFAPSRRGGKGIALMADEVYGPICAGDENDKHQFGRDRDGHPVNSAHINTNAYFFRSRDHDGPMLYEGLYPNPPHWPLRSPVHLSWDGALVHPWTRGMRQGMWRWWCEVPYTGGGGPPSKVPPVVPPTTPRTPGGPTTPGPGGPATPGTPGPGTPKRGGGGPAGPTTPGPGAPGGGRPAGPAGPTTPGPGRPPVNPLFPPPGPKTGPPITPVPGGGRPKTWPITPPAGPGKPPRGRGWWPVPGVWPKGPPAPAPANPITPRPDEPKKPSGTPPADPNAGQEQRLRPNDPPTDQKPGVVTHIGDQMPTVGLHSTFFPGATGFAAVQFRPELTVKDFPGFEHNPYADADDVDADEEVRPQVVVARAWGAQGGSGEWLYDEPPHTSRARGGIAAGGVLFAPPRFELSDYLLAGGADTTVVSTESYVACAPGVSFALGLPTTAGGLAAGSAVITQVPAATNANTPAAVKVVDSTGAAQTLLQLELDQASDERVASFPGTDAVILPVGTTAQRPSALLAAGAVRVNTSGANDVLEFWDAQGSAWVQVGTGGAGVTDHGALTGLADDDHTQYSKADGTRAFSAVVSGVTPTAAAHLATKGYVDDGFQPLATNLTAWVALIASLTEGDLFYVDENGDLAKLPIGTLGQVLTVDNASGSLLPSWQSP